LEERLTGVGANVKRYMKPTFTKPAPVDLRHEIATECQVVIEAQSKSLGYSAMARVFTPHPIQDRTDDEMRAYADAAFDDIVAHVTAG
ncbi:unnamed protein product, partial [Symbiodinium sp. KB8]